MTQPLWSQRESSPVGEVSNSESTFRALSIDLATGHSLLINWIDGHGTRMTVLMACPIMVGAVPGIYPRSMFDRWLTVAIEGYGTYSFKVVDEPLAPDYIGEKLMRNRVNVTTEALAELVGGVRMAMARL